MDTQTPSTQSDGKAMQRIWRSIFPAPLRPRTGTERRQFLRKNLLLHFRPPAVDEKTLRFSLSWGLGGIAVTLVIMQMATGCLLKFVYVPTPVEAYPSVRTIIDHIPFGRLIRNLHHWCANLLVVVLMLHMLRVFLTGAFHAPRQFNWVIGVALLGLILTANLSGYLLPYDQLAYWAVTVVTAMLGYLPAIGSGLQHALASGSDLSLQTLPLFYAIHTAVIPAMLAGLMGFHFWRVRKADGLVKPRKASASIDPAPVRVDVFPHLLVREAATALAVTAVMLVWSTVFDAPLTGPANPGLSPNPVRAPWYFAGFQELLLHVHPVVAVAVVPLSISLFLVIIPYLSYPRSTAGIWFASAGGRRQSLYSAIMAATIAPLLIVVDVRLIKTAPWLTGIAPAVRDGLLPMLLIGLIAAGWILILKRRLRAELNEIIQSIFVCMAAGMLVLTLTGILFRGPSMQLIWPW